MAIKDKLVKQAASVSVSTEGTVGIGTHSLARVHVDRQIMAHEVLQTIQEVAGALGQDGAVVDDEAVVRAGTMSSCRVCSCPEAIGI